jgi:hypothetical protein
MAVGRPTEHDTAWNTRTRHHVDQHNIILHEVSIQVIQSIKMVPSGIKIGEEQLNILAYANDIALIGENEIEIRKLFVEMENIARKFGLQINQEDKKHDSGKEKQFTEK